ncbi:hypothetical protein M8818_004682 [Zalaria obscura]|uniref:Uncharacterized protein n=1 Tax=Zalaria obscura TaxID=2024903 RepID=A0ACC3SCA9_9PEZI
MGNNSSSQVPVELVDSELEHESLYSPIERDTDYSRFNTPLTLDLEDTQSVYEGEPPQIQLHREPRKSPVVEIPETSQPQLPTTLQSSPPLPIFAFMARGYNNRDPMRTEYPLDFANASQQLRSEELAAAESSQALPSLSQLEKKARASRTKAKTASKPGKVQETKSQEDKEQDALAALNMLRDAPGKPTMESTLREEEDWFRRKNEEKEDAVVSSQAKKPRGRPRKNPVAPVNGDGIVEATQESAQASPKVKRGRKAKKAQMETGEVVMDSQPAPAEDVPEAEDVAAAPQKKQRKRRSTGKKLSEEKVVEDEEVDAPLDQVADKELPTPPESGTFQQDERIDDWISSQPQTPADYDDQAEEGANAPVRDDIEDYEIPAEPEREPPAESSNKKKRKRKSDHTGTAESKKRSRKSGADAGAGAEAEQVADGVDATTQRKSKRSRKSAATDGEETTAQPTQKRPRQSAVSARLARPSMTASELADRTTGPFSQTEIALVERTIDEYRAEHGFGRQRMNDKIQDKSDKTLNRELWNSLRDALPNRDRKSIQRFCRRRFHNLDTGEWTPEQDQLLQDAQAERPNKWTYVGAKVGRLAEDCRDRWVNHLSSLQVRNNGVWTQEEESALENAIRECLAALEDSGMEIDPDMPPESWISWSTVANKLGNRRNRLQCRMKYMKMSNKEGYNLGRTPTGTPFASRRVSVSSAEAENPPRGSTQNRIDEDALARHQALLPGDMYRMVQEIQAAVDTGHLAGKRAFWAQVTRKAGDSPWTTPDRKLVYKRLRRELRERGVEEEEGFEGIVEAMLRYLEEVYSEEELGRQSQPLQRIDRTAKKYPLSQAYITQSDDEEGEAVVKNEAMNSSPPRYLEDQNQVAESGDEDKARQSRRQDRQVADTRDASDDDEEDVVSD